MLRHYKWAVLQKGARLNCQIRPPILVEVVDDKKRLASSVTEEVLLSTSIVIVYVSQLISSTIFNSILLFLISPTIFNFSLLFLRHYSNAKLYLEGTFFPVSNLDFAQLYIISVEEENRPCVLSVVFILMKRRIQRCLQ